MLHRLFITKADRVRMNEVFQWYSTRSKKDRKALGVNGCGPKVAGWAVPELAFHEACELHDILYMLGGNSKDRWIADAVFLDLMLSFARTGPLRRRRMPVRLWKRAAAHLYFWAVRLWGAGSFQWGPRLTLGALNQLIYRNRH